MNDEILFRFYSNDPEQVAVHNFMLETLDSVILEIAYKGDSTEGARLAKNAIDEAFVRLKVAYGEKQKPIINSTR